MAHPTLLTHLAKTHRAVFDPQHRTCERFFPSDVVFSISLANDTNDFTSHVETLRFFGLVQLLPNSQIDVDAMN